MAQAVVRRHVALGRDPAALRWMASRPVAACGDRPSGLAAQHPEVPEGWADTAFEAQARILRSSAQAAFGDHVRIAEQLADDHAPAGPQDARELAQGGVLIGDLAEDGDKVGGVEGAVGVGQLSGVAFTRLDVLDGCIARAPGRVIKHLLLEIEDVQRPVRRKRLGHRKRVVTGARPDLEDGLAGAGRECLDQAAAGDERMRRLDPEPLAIGARRRVLAPPHRSGGDGPDRDRSDGPDSVMRYRYAALLVVVVACDDQSWARAQSSNVCQRTSGKRLWRPVMSTW
jgi:hypothetical protein